MRESSSDSRATGTTAKSLIGALRRGALVVAVLATAAACGGEQTSLLEGVPYRTDTVATATPAFAWVADPVVAARGLPVLRDVTLPEGYREFRVWVGFGLFRPHELLRIVETEDGRAEGELLAWWARHETTDSMPPVNEVYGRDACTVVGTNELAGYCRIRFRDEPEWRAVLSRLDNLEAGALPDPSILPGGRMALDGRSIEVEVRAGARYHSYHYDNPDAQPWPDAKTAGKILDLVDGLVTRRHAQRPAATTPGR